MANELVIIGAGGFGREAAALVETINAASDTWHLRGFVDDNASLHDTQKLGYPVLGGLEWMMGRENLNFTIAIGAPDVRRAVARRAMDMGIAGQPATLIHPAVALHRTVHIGEGSIICGGCSLTVDIHVGAHSILNLHCTVGHDAEIQDFATLHPGVHLSGGTTIGTEAELGTGAVVLPERTVGDQSTVGAGAVVTHSIPPQCTAVGVPAQPLPE